MQPICLSLALVSSEKWLFLLHLLENTLLTMLLWIGNVLFVGHKYGKKELWCRSHLGSWEESAYVPWDVQRQRRWVVWAPPIKLILQLLPFFFLQCISWDVIGCFLFSCSHQRPFENFTQNILLSWASSISPSAVRNFILFTSVVKIQKKKFEADLKTTVTYQWLPLVNYKPEGENRPMAHLFVFFPTLRAFSCHLIN